MRVSFRCIFFAALVLLAGCSSLNPFSRKAPRNEPAPLVQFTPSMAARTVWTARIGKSGDNPLVPAVVDARVYAASADGEIFCLEAADGKPIWKIKAGTELTAGVGTDGKVLVVVGIDGAILAFDAADGKPLWKAQASTEVLSPPALGSGVVVIRSMDNRIAAYDLESGNRRWFVQRTAPALALRASPGILINDGIAYIALPAGRLLALAAQTGAPRWDAPIAEPRGATELERVAVRFVLLPTKAVWPAWTPVMARYAGHANFLPRWGRVLISDMCLLRTSAATCRPSRVIPGAACGAIHHSAGEDFRPRCHLVVRSWLEIVRAICISSRVKKAPCWHVCKLMEARSARRPSWLGPRSSYSHRMVACLQSRPNKRHSTGAQHQGAR